MADNTNFFKDNKPEPEASTEAEATPEKIKVGDTEFTADELGELVGKAQKVSEFEEKQGQTWDEVTQSWGKRGERIGELKKKVEELEKVQSQPQPQLGEQPSEEQMKAQVVEEAKKFGLLTRDEATSMMDELYQQRRAGERLLEETRGVIEQAQKDGKPAVTEEKLLEFMSDPANPKSPEMAYKVMFDKELEEWKEKKLMENRKKGMFTETKSTSGNKEPKPESPPTRDNLEKRLSEFLSEG